MQGPPAALIHETFGEFLDNCQHVPLEDWICQQVTNLNALMSASYRTPIPESELDEKSQMLLQRLGVQLQGQLPSTSTSEDSYQPSSDEFEAERMVIVRRYLTSLLGHYAAAGVKPNLDVSSPTQVWTRSVVV